VPAAEATSRGICGVGQPFAQAITTLSSSGEEPSTQPVQHAEPSRPASVLHLGSEPPIAGRT
jgi:hypothetical protein